MISEKEIELAQYILRKASECGASDARVTLVKSSEEMIATLDGEIDRVTRCEDRSISLSLFVDGRYGSFSTNKLDVESLDNFIARDCDIVRMLAPDVNRSLPAAKSYCKTAVSGREMEIFDDSIRDISAELRRKIALEASVYSNSGINNGEGWKVISEEGEYSDSEYDLYEADTAGMSCRHSETSFDYGVEITIEDSDGEKYSGYAWHSAPFLNGLEYKDCGRQAVKKACAQIGSEAAPSGKYNMVVDSEVASKMVSPLLNALNGFSIQQNNSFLKDSLGKQIFPEGFTILDRPFIKGQTGSKLFDGEGVATSEEPIIENGIVKKYFINTYMSHKLGMEPTNEEATRPQVQAWPRKGLKRSDILEMCGNGILVTDFNGGNSNSATGDFSYGVEGLLFENGEPVRPISGMLITGNFIQLWSNMIATGEDARPCMSKLVPTLAFKDVDFSG